MKCTGNTVLAIFAALIVIAIAGVAIAGIAAPHSREPIQRYCFNSPSVLGTVAVDSVENTISWDLQITQGTLGDVLALQIIGPVPLDSPDRFTGPLLVALCGVPSMLTCDTSTPGTVRGTIVETSPGQLSLKTLIQSIRDTPWRYFLTVNTANAAGEYQQHLTQVCGTK